ncbi:iron-sulfur cluster assembly protein [Nocardioides zeicaulis]|uniref:Iron-sulfur cluster assembly protein n=1 Tax=Nocardioides zeicaulis TaxID=1776857 RepID=A0ABV6E4F9_9ACTN
MSRHGVPTEAAATSDVREVLRTVAERALDEPLAAHDFVDLVSVTDDGDLEVHLRLPRSGVPRSLACLVVSDARDALADLPWSRVVTVALDGHGDSADINAVLAVEAGAGRYAGGRVVTPDLAGLQRSFRREAHVAAAERCLAALARRRPWHDSTPPGDVVLGDLLPGRHLAALLRRRRALGLPNHPTALVLADPDVSAP